MQTKDFKYREIPFNYTSFSDKEIFLNYFDSETWETVNDLREQRKTGRSARLLYEIIGDIFIIERNPYLYEDFLTNTGKRKKLRSLHEKRFSVIRQSAVDNHLAGSLLEKTENLNKNFFAGLSRTVKERRKALALLKKCTSEKNIFFSPFHRILHATDATDWRVEYPFVVVYPDSAEEISSLIKAAAELNLCVIPRGGGTGLTGGAVPVRKDTMMLNTEKLNTISEITYMEENGARLPVVSAGAGVVTDKIIEECAAKGFIFATDPTSSWASTIGGNLAENAGGKKCVMWGTAIDNVYSYQMVDPKGNIISVKRVNHPYRKIQPDDIIEFAVITKDGKNDEQTKIISLTGDEIRKKDLGKDITNKALNGLPGIQKEGGDGIIVSAQFVLYTPFQHCRTLCIEFFGSNMHNASKAIVEINDFFASDKNVFLTALEHFDEKYVNAINYRNKSSRNEIPKAVLLIDIESNDKALLNTACERVVQNIPGYNAEGILAAGTEESKTFWNDRKHLGAIAKHTNAFKLNEDVVIPLKRLPEFADYIEMLNHEYNLSNSLEALELMITYLNDKEKAEWINVTPERREIFLQDVLGTESKYRKLLKALTECRIEGLPEAKFVFRQIQNNEIIVSFDDEVILPVAKSFHGFEIILDTIEKLIKNVRSRRIIIATHMHAGDGNVHVNIPVHSNDYKMMQEADEAAGLAMREAVRLGGVVSGEHGIGLTKLKFIDKELLTDYQNYKKSADPDNIFNPEKLDPDFKLHRIYTPSFNLLECEALILESTDLERLNSSIASCVRCGKCKTVCNTHYPASAMMYNPRNKILSVGLITEAILFSAQTLDMRSFKQFVKLREIADHCTVCHKCKVPCPVKIDFGEVSLTMREQLAARKKAAKKVFTSSALFYLGRKKYYVNKFFRLALLKAGYSGQRMASAINGPFAGLSEKYIPKLGCMLRAPFPKSGEKSLREVFNLKSPDTFYSFTNPDKPVRGSVVYFPGCGSERMFPDISFAAIAMLYHSGIRVVIPHEFLCCGYPFKANGKTNQAEIKSYENRVLFHRIADAIGYMSIDSVIVSCGTCFDMLENYNIGSIFHEAKLMDVNEYIAAGNLFSTVNPALKIPLYHEPCHNPLKSMGYEKTFNKLYGHSPVPVPDCCGEAGTLALSRPDISKTLKERKERTIHSVTGDKNVEVLTTCPSCVLGLSKLNSGSKISGKSLIVYNAEQFIGKNWKKDFIKTVKKNGVEKIIF